MQKAVQYVFISYCLILSNVGFSQLNIPIARSYTQSIYQIFLKDSAVKNQNTHLGFKPINEKKTNTDIVFHDQGNYYYWITQKLFKEHFLIFKGNDFWCVADPLIDLEVGNDFSDVDQPIKLWNTRGIRIQAKFFKNFAFETSIYENQATLLNYQTDYVLSHGEFDVSGNSYKQINAIVPGYARTKIFKTTGFDFAFSKGYFNYQPSKWLSIEAGNGNHFIGHGYRSLLLSDFSVNYPYLKPELLLFNGMLQYNIIYASQQNLYRLPFHLTPEANYERKLSVGHYLEYSFNKNIQVGLFENNTWVRVDSQGTIPLNIASLNPIVGNGLFISEINNKYNSFYGLNASISLKSIRMYTQMVFDNNKIGGYQFGLGLYDLFLPKLNLQIEYNQITSETYLNKNKRANYNHSNLPLAHPIGNNFQEIIAIMDFEFKRWFITNTSIYSLRFVSDTGRVSETLLMQLDNANPNIANNVWFNRIEVGYRFNKKYNLELYCGYLNRISTVQSIANSSNFAYFGIKTNLHQKTLDW
ncbi:MAG: hypothetical protein AB8B74_12670 [Crocinitomicaceae bacterium]